MAAMAGAIGPMMGVVGTAGQTASSIMATDVQAKSLQAEGRSITEQAKFDERQSRRESSLYRGKANATVAASGVSLSSGSPLLMELDRYDLMMMEQPLAHDDIAEHFDVSETSVQPIDAVTDFRRGVNCI